MKTDSYFSSDFFVGNRKRLRESVGDGQLIVLGAHGTLQRTADTSFPFAQERNYWYLTGVSSPDTFLVMHGDEEYLVLPPYNAMHEVFDGAPDAAAMSAISGVEEVLSYKAGWQRLASDLAAVSHVYMLGKMPGYHPRYQLYLNPAHRRLRQQVQRRAAHVTLRDIRPSLAHLRVVKQSPEIAAIKAAVRITTETLTELRTQLGSLRTEREIEAAITYGFLRRGARGHAYSPIVAGGVRATTLHYVDNAAPVRPDELIVVDVGAEMENYAADITRTLTVQPPTPRQQAVVAAVRAVQQDAATHLRPGALLKDVEAQVARSMTQALVGLGLATSANDTQALRRYYPHATSHFLGLDVHDVGDYTQPLQAGTVLTCEPGIYIPEEGIGVRLEDDILITPDGHENLSCTCSYDPYAV